MCTPQMRRYRWKQSREDLSWGSTSSTITVYTQTHTHTHTHPHTHTHTKHKHTHTNSTTDPHIHTHTQTHAHTPTHTHTHPHATHAHSGIQIKQQCSSLPSFTWSQCRGIEMMNASCPLSSTRLQSFTF